MGKISISRTLLVRFWVFIFLVFFTSGCSADIPDDIGQIYIDYGKALRESGNSITRMGVFLGKNTKNIVECSSDEIYIDKLYSLKKDIGKTLKTMSTIKVPDELLQYHNLHKQTLTEYYQMLDFLIKSSTSIDSDEKKKFLDKAAAKVTKANALGKQAKDNMPAAEALIEKYMR
ncbi:MAG: hypothetical protein ISS92_04040 [Candidatus Omnitrophica bacterium]|nr:hypothetical protein [Candidatus Omnitrophota bacterium]